MIVHDPAEKNLKHKTDVLSWSDIPWERCDMNFRPPSLGQLSMSLGQAFLRLLIAATVGLISCLLVLSFVVPIVIRECCWAEAVVVALVVGTLAVVGLYRPLPRSIGDQRRVDIGIWLALSVLAFFAAAQYSQSHNVFDLGVLLLFTVALPANLYFADQLTGHMVHWITADPVAARNTMVVWRNAWCGRFVTSHVGQVIEQHAPGQSLRQLRRYWTGHLLVSLTYVCGVSASLLGMAIADIQQPGILIVIGSTSFLAILASINRARNSDSLPRFRCTLGQWFEYQKNSHQPPWMMNSPAGAQLRRSFTAFMAVVLLAVALMFISLTDNKLDPNELNIFHSASLIDTLIVSGVVVVVAPLQTLIIAFVISTQVVSIYDETFQTEEDEEDDREK